jgi:hypothetical protein
MPTPITCTTSRCCPSPAASAPRAKIVDALAKHAAAEGFATMTLVAVNGSQGFWEKHGFVRQDVPDLVEKLQPTRPKPPTWPACSR